MAALSSYINKISLKQIFTCSAVFFIMISRARQKVLYYDIVKSDEVIGHLILYKTINANKTLYTLKSTVNTKFIFSYSNQVNETVVFENGKMIYSNFHQKQNGKEIFNETQLTKNRFKIIKNGKAYSQEYTPIFANILQLYTDPPSSGIEVFSNHYQQFLKITKNGNQYRLMLPDGNYNLYAYKNGICNQVEIVHTFFTVHFILKNIIIQ
jgi:hypothetical protein